MRPFNVAYLQYLQTLLCETEDRCSLLPVVQACELSRSVVEDVDEEAMTVEGGWVPLSLKGTWDNTLSGVWLTDKSWGRAATVLTEDKDGHLEGVVGGVGRKSGGVTFSVSVWWLLRGEDSDGVETFVVSTEDNSWLDCTLSPTTLRIPAV